MNLYGIWLSSNKYLYNQFLHKYLINRNLTRMYSEIYQNETQSNPHDKNDRLSDDIQYNMNSLQDFYPESHTTDGSPIKIMTDSPTINIDPESNNLPSTDGSSIKSLIIMTDNSTINIDKNFQSYQPQQSINTIDSNTGMPTCCIIKDHPKKKVSFKSSIKQLSTTINEPIHLKHGILQSNNIDIPYLYVPTGWRPSDSNDNDDDNCNVWDAIFQTNTMNGSRKPEFIFYLDECPDDLYNPQSAYRLYKASELKKKELSVDDQSWRMEASKDRHNLLKSKFIDPKNNEEKF